MNDRLTVKSKYVKNGYTLKALTANPKVANLKKSTQIRSWRSCGKLSVIFP